MNGSKIRQFFNPDRIGKVKNVNMRIVPNCERLQKN